MNEYKKAGVDIEKGDLFVERIKSMVGSTYDAQVTAGVGGFGSLYDQGDRYLVAGTDGVGTKIKIAQELGIHDTVGIDLVAMCVNDIICCGARPLFFLDYMAVGGLELDISENLIKGIVEGCKQSECALIGGETAEMPDLYKRGEYDLAGFAVGEVMKEDLIDGTNIKDGDLILGLKSSGFHSNGYSLLRKWVGDDKELAEKLLKPTKIYVKELKAIRKDFVVKGIAHITGGGIHNIGRINKNFDYLVDSFPGLDQVDPIFAEIFAKFDLEKDQQFQTFNRGIGLSLIMSADQGRALMEQFPEILLLGKVQTGSGQVKLV